MIRISTHLICQGTPLSRQTGCMARTYCTKNISIADTQKYERNEEETLTSRVTNIIEKGKAPKHAKRDVYHPRIKYSGFLRNSTWIYKNADAEPLETSESAQMKDDVSENKHEGDPRFVYWKKFALLMGFSGTNYMGMQFNPNVPTIEDSLFQAMLKNKWITEENFKHPWTVEFQRGSRTDRGVSAARQCCSLLLPRAIDIDALHRDLPDDIRVFGVQRVTPAFDARHNCEARTYSYTLPTISFANYNEQTTMNDYRLPLDQLQRVNEVLNLFVGNINFHNFTPNKQHFDRSSVRRIFTITCSEPFVLNDVEFARITVKGQSFMLHQIRKMVGFSLAVIREIIPIEMLERALTKETFNVPTAPGLGLVLERLHFDKYNRSFGHLHGELDWNKCETDIEQFRRNQIDPIIIATEIKEESMINWLDFLVNHSYDEYEGITEKTYDDSWGEDPEFWEKVKK